MKSETKKAAVKTAEIEAVKRLGDSIERQNKFLSILFIFFTILVFEATYILFWLETHNYLSRLLGGL